MPLNKTITYIIWRAELGGVEKSLFNYINYLQPEYQITIFSLKETKCNIFNNKNIKVVHGGKKLFRIFLCLYKYCIDNKNCIYHVMNAGPMVIMTCKLAGVKKIIYHIRGTKYFKYSKIKMLIKCLWKISLRNNDIILANSNYSKQQFIEHINKNLKIKVIYNPFDNHLFYFKEKTNSLFTIIYAGRFTKGKNLIKWLEISSAIHKEFPNIKFSLIGNGPVKDQIEEFIDTNDQRGYVTILEYQEDIYKYLQEASILLFLSQYESFGNIVVESILCGTPVIVSNIPSMKEIFEDHPNFVVNLKSNNINDDIIKKIRNYDLLKAETELAHQEFIDRFSLENHLKTLRLIYECY